MSLGGKYTVKKELRKTSVAKIMSIGEYSDLECEIVAG
jgi:hypothetical protein